MDASDAGDTAVDYGTVRVRKSPAMQRRKPTPLQTARWKAVQKAKRRGLSIRAVAREVGIHRDTAKKYMEADNPPCTQIVSDRSHLLTSRVAPVTFMLAT